MHLSPSSPRVPTRPSFSALSVALRLALASAVVLPFNLMAQVVIAEGSTVTVPGTYSSPWNIPSSGERYDLLVNGGLIVRDGGTVNTASMHVIGDESTPASVVVDGSGSVLNVGGRLDFGTDLLGLSFVKASLSITNGGAVNSDLTYFGFSRALKNIDITVSGVGSRLVTGQTHVGRYSAPTFVNVIDGGTWNSRGQVVVGYLDSTLSCSCFSQSQVNVSGNGSSWSVENDLYVVEGSQVVVNEAASLSAKTVGLWVGSHRGGGAPGSIFSGGYLAIGGQLDVRSDEDRPVASAPLAPGRVTADQIVFNAGVLAFNHTSANYIFAPTLVTQPTPSGSSEHRKLVLVYAGTTHLTADSGGFEGKTSVFGGKLAVDGILGGTATVYEGGTLGGAGTLLGNVLIDRGGKLAPGNSIGTFTVGGDLTFAPGSLYEVEVTPQGGSDQVVVGGKAIINGGSVISLGQDSGFKPFTEYTILTAAGGVSGQFAGANNNYAFLTPSLSYQPNAVTLQLLRNDVSFGAIGATANQRAVAAGAESTGPGRPVWNAIAMLSADQARAALDSLSGELHASTQTALIEDALSIQHAALDGYADSEQRGDTRVWIKALGARSQTDATRETAKLERDSSGLLIGADFAVGEDWRVGGLLGAGKTRNDVDALGSRSETDNLHYGVYADAAWENGLRLRLGGIRSDYDVDTRRRASVAGLGSDFTATTDARATQFYGELGYAFDAGSVELQPFLGVSQIKLDTDGFGERGGDGALQAQDADATTRYASLGLRLGYGFGDASRWRLGGSLAWRRASGDLEPVSKLRFDGGQSFLIEGAPIARNAAVVTAGVNAQLSERTSLDVSYLGQIASDADDHGASAKLTIRF